VQPDDDPLLGDLLGHAEAAASSGCGNTVSSCRPVASPATVDAGDTSAWPSAMTNDHLSGPCTKRRDADDERRRRLLRTAVDGLRAAGRR
jgi:hypothetical protein